MRPIASLTRISEENQTEKYQIKNKGMLRVSIVGKTTAAQYYYVVLGDSSTGSSQKKHDTEMCDGVEATHTAI